MTEKGLKPYRVAMDLGRPVQTVVNWTRGSVPQGEHLNKLAAYLGVTTDYLLGKSDDQVVLPKGDVQIDILARAARKMTTEEKQKLIDIAKVMFERAFDEKSK